MLKGEMERGRKKGNLQRVAEIRYGEIPELEKALEEAEAKSAKRKEEINWCERSHRARNCRSCFSVDWNSVQKCFRKNFKNYVFWRNICTSVS